MHIKLIRQTYITNNLLTHFKIHINSLHKIHINSLIKKVNYTHIKSIHHTHITNNLLTLQLLQNGYLLIHFFKIPVDSLRKIHINSLIKKVNYTHIKLVHHTHITNNLLPSSFCKMVTY